MKSLLAFILITLSFNVFAQDLSLYDVYQEMSPEAQEKLLNEIEKEGHGLNDLEEIKVEHDFSGGKLLTTFSYDCSDMFIKKKYEWLMSVGAGYLYPIGPSIGTTGILYNKTKSKRVLRIGVEFSSTLQFRRGSVNVAEFKPSIYLWKKGAYIGPVIQVIHVNNPLILGKNNWFLPAYGAQLGKDFYIKTGKSKRIGVDLSAQATIGGFGGNPKLFMLVGGSIKFTLGLGKNWRNHK